jgi:DNA-binding NtrC family response regulator
MSAQLSSTAPIDAGPEKNLTNLPLELQDPKFSLTHHSPSASQSHNGVEVMSVEDCSKGLTTNLQSIRLLVVDESDQVRQMCCQAAERFGFVAVEAESISAARKILERKDTAVLMLDFTRAESEGKSLLAEMKSLCPNALIIGMSASATIASAVETMRAGASDYLSKPFPEHILVGAVERAAMRLCFDAERRKLRDAANSWSGMGDVLGKSKEMEDLYRALSNVARSTHPVMIVGEIGSGRELVARSIHSNGPGGSKPLISVECKSMSSDLLEAELFGGLTSTSGKAAAQRRGLLASLEGGTVFLDEIDGLTLDLQGRLARTLKEKQIWREGGVRLHRLSVRILAATSHDLMSMVNSGHFRMDLYGLLSVVNLKIPPLRARPGDVVLLAERFLEKIGRAAGISRTLSKEAVRMLEIYDWPENTRELEDAITHAYTLSSGPELESNLLPPNILAFSRTKNLERERDLASSEEPKKDVVVTISAMEKRAIHKALQQTKGDRVEAARLLGIGKTTLYRKLKEYSLDVEP